MLPALNALEDVTPAWITTALRARYPGVTVTEMRPGRVIRGMATKAQYFLSYDDAGSAAGLPPSLWLKCGIEVHSQRSAPLYAAEVKFYRDLAPLLEVNCAMAYAADPDAGSGILLLEDLAHRGSRFGNPGDTLTVDEAKAAIDILARLHSFPQRATTLPSWLDVPGAIYSVDVVGEYFDFWDTAITCPRFEAMQGPFRNRERMLQAARAMEAIMKKDRGALIHGDAHPGNMFFDTSGAIGLLDWQTTTLGSWALDVAYGLTMSLDIEDRRRHERDLLCHYLDARRAHGAEAIAFDDAWLAYRQHLAWCFLTSLCPVERQPEDVCTTWASRAAAAMADLDMLAALAA